jgi:hypothetical protein
VELYEANPAVESSQRAVDEPFRAMYTIAETQQVELNAMRMELNALRHGDKHYQVSSSSQNQRTTRRGYDNSLGSRMGHKSFNQRRDKSGKPMTRPQLSSSERGAVQRAQNQFTT